MEDISSFVNNQLLSLHIFMHQNLTNAIHAHAIRASFKQVPVGWNERMRCVGIKRFKEQNGIEA